MVDGFAAIDSARHSLHHLSVIVYEGIQIMTMTIIQKTSAALLRSIPIRIFT